MKPIERDIAVLTQGIEKTLELIQKIEDFYESYKQNEYANLGKTRVNAIALSEIMVDYYTLLETCFLRISQFFENNIDQSHWHKDLLEKMTFEISNVRPRVISLKFPLA